jgi:hypothetical protein
MIPLLALSVLLRREFQKFLWDPKHLWVPVAL